MMGYAGGAKNPQQSQVKTFVGNTGHAVEFRVRRVLGVGNEDCLRFAPGDTVRAFRAADEAFPERCPTVAAIFHVDGVDLPDGIPAHEEGRPPTADLRCGIDYGVAGVGRPRFEIGGKIEVEGHTGRSRIALPDIAAKTLAGICSARIAKDGTPLPFVWKNVVLLRTCEFYFSQHRFFPVDSVFRNGETADAVAISFDNHLRAGAPHLPLAGQIAHFEALRFVDPHHTSHIHIVSLPRIFGPNNRVVGHFFGAIYRARTVSHTFDQVIVDEKLLVRGYIDQGHDQAPRNRRLFLKLPCAGGL